MIHRVIAWLLLSASLGATPTVFAQQAGQKLFFEGDMVRGSGPGVTSPACVLTSQFKRGEFIVWRIRVLDPKTGQAVDDKGLKNMLVVLPDGQKFEAHYGSHPRGKKDDFFWTVSWKVPESYPTGTIGYKVIATDKEGASTTWEPFKVSLSQLTIIP